MKEKQAVHGEPSYRLPPWLDAACLVNAVVFGFVIWGLSVAFQGWWGLPIGGTFGLFTFYAFRVFSPYTLLVPAALLIYAFRFPGA